MSEISNSFFRAIGHKPDFSRIKISNSGKPSRDPIWKDQYPCQSEMVTIVFPLSDLFSHWHLI